MAGGWIRMLGYLDVFANFLLAQKLAPKMLNYKTLDLFFFFPVFFLKLFTMVNKSPFFRNHLGRIFFWFTFSNHRKHAKSKVEGVSWNLRGLKITI